LEEEIRPLFCDPRGKILDLSLHPCWGLCWVFSINSSLKSYSALRSSCHCHQHHVIVQEGCREDSYTYEQVVNPGLKIRWVWAPSSGFYHKLWSNPRVSPVNSQFPLNSKIPPK
jgi:hypothetical protein